ncbi:Ubiquinone/menaquinone biosynthesis C-methylase UbiE [Ruegeria halocynthiae]|uniref:Ubiquinone/menaquinone biosynthesis C-methylase UbiE n=1 Tax=Ruegeria halocynthiae TaxID=985054 RepID=A0A1H2ZPS4_9RHOB|nr:methyltransferase domain-containing protein [Ruegeria halocynthiae]SDX19522.1 Ubiquinone/menaquinone biosynthesis C-methylase UbiE [Ruegeria halocynthiae]
MVVDATQDEIQAGRGYEALFVPALFAPWCDHMIGGAGIIEGAHVLDIACGTGVLTRAAHACSGHSGRVVGLDPAPGMIATAKEVEPDVEWVLGSAEDLPFADGSFDFVISQFGMMFFQDLHQAAREMYRVTKPGGRLAVAIWHTIDLNPAYRDIVAVLEEYVSPEAANSVRLPFSLGDPDEVATILSQAGFDGIAFETKSEQATFPSTRTMVEVELRGWLPLFDIHLSEGKIADVLTLSDVSLSKYATPSGKAAFPTTAYIMTAQKPE